MFDQSFLEWFKQVHLKLPEYPYIYIFMWCWTGFIPLYLMGKIFKLLIVAKGIVNFQNIYITNHEHLLSRKYKDSWHCIMPYFSPSFPPLMKFICLRSIHTNCYTKQDILYVTYVSGKSNPYHVTGMHS